MCDGCRRCLGTFSISSDCSPFSHLFLEMTTASVHQDALLHITKLISWTAANQMAQQMTMMNPGAGANLFGPGQDADKLFQNEAENLEVIEHRWILDSVEQRLLKTFA